MARKRTQYDRGRETEYKIMKILEEQGFFGVTRTAGSHGFYDVVAIVPLSHVLFIQAKRSKTMVDLEQLYREDLAECREIAKQLPRETQLEFWLWVDRKGWQQKIVVKKAGEIYKGDEQP
jgi:Holliday junction resolvase